MVAQWILCLKHLWAAEVIYVFSRFDLTVGIEIEVRDSESFLDVVFQWINLNGFAVDLPTGGAETVVRVGPAGFR